MDSNPYFLRIAKALALALIMYFSVRFLGFPTTAALMLALIPFALGSLNIMTRFAYSLTAVVLIIAAFSTIIKREDVERVKNNILSIIEKGSADKAPIEKDPVEKPPVQKGN